MVIVIIIVVYIKNNITIINFFIIIDNEKISKLWMKSVLFFDVLDSVIIVIRMIVFIFIKIVINFFY